MLTRRKLLRNGVTLSLGSIYHGSLMGLLTGIPSNAHAKESVRVQAQGLVVADPTFCVGCRRCEVGCCWSHDSGDVSPALSRVKIEANMLYGPYGVGANYLSAQGQLGDRTIVPATCIQCDTCMEICGQQAISVDPNTGAKVVDENKCIGCGRCVAACPQDVLMVDQHNHRAVKCDLCQGTPNCAQMCPTGALKYYDWDQANEALKQYEQYMQLV